MPYPHAPPPWTTKASIYFLLTTLRHPLSPSLGPHLDNYSGGWAFIQIIRYTSTPVGPYDELMILPGDFTVPAGRLKRKKKLRIGRIYVSQKETCYNGRKNWNIPKQLARFEFSPGTSDSELRVSVFPPDLKETTPFFEATLSPSTWLPTFPISTKYLRPIMNTPLVQPLLAAGEEDYLCGTETWKAFDVHVWSDRARVMRVKVENKADQEEWWPKTDVWSFGLWLEEGTAVIGEAEEFVVDGDKVD